MKIQEKISPRETILAMLEETEAWISGEGISQRLGISRAAVGKHITALRTAGHAIKAMTRKGYKLLAKHDSVDGEAVAASLTTHVFGKAGWTFFETTTSTNLKAARLAEEGVREGHVVIAERQTKGRGRKGHDWFFVPRGIQFSVLLYPHAPFWDAESFTRLAAHAVADAVKELTGLAVAAKMPNDVLIHGKKIAGVLVETGYRGDEPEWAVIGIGCNVNALLEDFPETIRDQATSILVESGRPVARNAILAAILGKLETAYETLHQGA
jgi:BirA family biotin operon repressor/biotin-[acetyl-CoA-carboxylase] ligase